MKIFLASVIVGPGTPKAVQTKLMKQYMGFDPSKGIDIPTLLFEVWEYYANAIDGEF